MLFKDFKKSLGQKIYNCYFLSCGKDKEDIYLKSSCINNLKNVVVPNLSDFNLQVFLSENLDVGSLKKSLETLPFLSERKLIIIKETEQFKGKEVINFLKKYMLAPLSSTILVIDECENSGFSELEKFENVCVVDCSRVEKSILQNFVLRACKNKNLEMDLDAVNKLIDYCDGYMCKIDIELDKLISFKLNEKEITSSDVDENVSKSEEYQIFELTNSLFARDAEKALFIVDDIIKNKKNISLILGLIYNHIRRSFYAKISKDSLADTAKMLEIKEFAVKKLKEQTSFVSAKRLKEMLVLCKDIDYKIKSGNFELITGIYNLVFSILV